MYAEFGIDHGFAEFTRKDYENILAMIGDESRVLHGDRINEEYSHDELSGTEKYPDVVVRALTAEEISDVMKYADSHRIPVTPRGAGTGLVGAAVPVFGGIVIDMSGMNRILELDEDNLTVTVEPGVLLMELGEFCESHDFLYPPDPGEKTATIGGNISTNAGGMRAVKYGVTRDYVRALEVVLSDGRILNVGGKVVKNSSGYSIKDLFIGSEGTLGIITRATLRLLPMPKKNISLLVPFKRLEDAIDTVPLIVRSKAQPTAVEFMQREVILDAERYLGSRFPDSSADAYLLLRFDGASREEIETQYDNVARICLAQGAHDVFIIDTDERNESVWKPRGAFLEAIKASTDGMDEVDVVVPRGSVNAMVSRLREVGDEIGIRIRYFGHAGDGNLHIYLLRDGMDEEEWHRKHDAAMDAMYERARELGGQVSGEHGIGFIKRPYLRESLDPELTDLMRGIKAVFDPNGILNPQKVV